MGGASVADVRGLGEQGRARAGEAVDSRSNGDRGSSALLLMRRATGDIDCILIGRNSGRVPQLTDLD